MYKNCTGGYKNANNKTYEVRKHETTKEAIPISPCSPDGSILFSENLQMLQLLLTLLRTSFYTKCLTFVQTLIFSNRIVFPDWYSAAKDKRGSCSSSTKFIPH